MVTLFYARALLFFFFFFRDSRYEVHHSGATLTTRFVALVRVFLETGSNLLWVNEKSCYLAVFALILMFFCNLCYTVTRKLPQCIKQLIN